MSVSLRVFSGLATFLALSAAVHAGEVTVTLDTRVLVGSPAGPFYVGFELADGSQTGDGNNAAAVSNIQFGGGSPILAACTTTGQGASGDLSSSITMTDLSIFAFCYQAFNPGSTLSFTVSYTNNVDPAGLPDEFVMAILDKNLQPIPTTGGVALLQIDFNSADPTVQVFAGDPTQPEAANGGSGIAISAPAVSGAGPNAPVLLSPSNGAAGVSRAPALSWNAASGATSYDVYFGAGGPPPFVENTAATTYSPGILAGTATYSWSVVARSATGTAPSATWSFTTQAMDGSMTANPGTTPQAAFVNTAFTALSVTVLDAASNPVPGVSVTFTAPVGGASGTFTNSSTTITVATNGSGVASASFTANGTAGPYTVTAAAAGLNTVNFSLSNTASFTIRTIQPPTGFSSFAMSGINNAGQVAVPAFAGYSQGFVATPSSIAEVPIPLGMRGAAGGSINTSGQVAGYSDNTPQAFIGSTSGSTAIPTPTGWLDSFGNGLNDFGTVVGYGYNNTTGYQAFVGTTAGSTPIPVPAGATESWGEAINNSNQVAGYAGSQAFVGTVSGITLIPLPSGWSTARGYAINGSGQVAGSLNNGNLQQAFVGSASNSMAIPLPAGATFSSASFQSISDSGVVVGNSSTGGWIWNASGGTRLLNSLVPTGWNITNGISISNNGLILAQGSYNGGAVEYVELNPQALGSITANPGTTPQTAPVNTEFGAVPAVTVKDAGGNPVAGVIVTFTAPANGASGLFSNSTNTITVTTNGSGVASAPFGANGISGGPYTVTAATAGLTPVDFSLTNAAIMPAPSGVNPGAGSSATQTFTFSFTDPNGYSDLSVLDVLINDYLDGIGACYVALVPASATSGYLYLVDDAGDGGYVSGTPMSLPTSSSLHNSQCTINGTGSSISASGNTLTLTLAITFAPAFSGNKIFYTAARSNTKNSGWQALGTWDVPGAAPAGPAVGGVTPGRSSNTGQTYTFTFTDSNGYSDLGVMDILTNSYLDGINACYIAYVPAGATNGYLYLVDDAGDGGYVSGSPLLLSSGGVLQNSQCTISAAGSSVSASGNTLTLSVAITFSPSFAGNQIFYLAARNNGTGNSGWQAVGSVTVP